MLVSGRVCRHTYHFQGVWEVDGSRLWLLIRVPWLLFLAPPNPPGLIKLELQRAVLYEFPRATVTNDHKWSGFKQPPLLMVHFWSLEAQHRSFWAQVKVLQGCLPSGGSGAESTAPLFHLLDVPALLGLWPAPLPLLLSHSVSGPPACLV